MRPPEEPGKKDNPYRAIGMVSAIGTDLALSVLGGVYLGKWIDSQFGTAPVFLVAGLLAGLAAGIYGIILLAKRFL